MIIYNTVGYLGFTVDHKKEPHSSIDPDQIRKEILNRLALMTDSELLSEIDWGETITDYDPFVEEEA